MNRFISQPTSAVNSDTGHCSGQASIGLASLRSRLEPIVCDSTNLAAAVGDWS